MGSATGPERCSGGQFETALRGSVLWLGGWAEGFLATGYDVIGFDNHRHIYETQVPKWPGCSIVSTIGHTSKYPSQLVLQDVLTLHGSQFKDATVIVASPPCQNYSYLAMPWSRSKNPDNSKAAKALRRRWETEGPDNRLFDACFRIQREAIFAANSFCLRCGHSDMWHDRQYGCSEDTCQCEQFRFPKRYIPLIVENVRGAQPWVGRSAWNYGSFHLWGDVPALMPINLKRAMKQNPDGTGHPTGSWFAIADSSQGDRREGQKTQGGSWFRERNGQPQPGIKNGDRGQKVPEYSDPRRNGGKGVHLTNPHENHEGLKRPGQPLTKGFNNWPKDESGAYIMPDGTKIGGDWFSDPQSTCRKHGSRSQARKAASAQIAKIPFPLAQHIAQVYKPR